MIVQRKISRRQFVLTSSIGATALGLGFKPQSAQKNVSPNNAINVGMIATGARAQQLMENIKEIPGTEIIAVCDAYTGRIERAIERTAGRAKDYGDYKKIIADKNIDVVVIASPDHLHTQQAIGAMESGKHIYIEKPLTYTIEEGLQLIEVAKRNKVAFQVGSTGMSSILALKAKEMIAAGKLGQVTMVRAEYNRNTAGGAWIYPIPPDASPDTMNWDMFLGAAPKHPFSPERFFRWRCYKDYSGGIPTDLFVHLCTTVHYIMNVEMCDSVIAMGGLYRWKESRDVPDTINASLAYPKGFMLNISSTFNNEQGDDRGIQFLGTEGSLELVRGKLIFTKENVYDSNDWVVESWPSELEKKYYQDPEIKADEQPWTKQPQVIPEGETYIAEGLGATMVHLHEFFDAVRNETATKEDVMVGHRAASCAHLVNLSIENKKTVYWDAKQDSLKTG
jgi:predicted dehydrogenase